MEIKSLRCNHCGANLEVKPRIKFFNCDYCGSSLTIKHSGNVTFTEVINDIKQDTDTLVDHSEVILVEKEIERLDREWLLERDKYMIRGKNGSVSEPDKSYSNLEYIGAGLFFTIFIGGLLAAFVSLVNESSRHGPPLIIAFVPLAMIVVIILALFSGRKSKEKYKEAKSKHEFKRQTLLNKLGEVKGKLNADQ